MIGDLAFCVGITILSTQLPSMDASGFIPQEKMSFDEKREKNENRDYEFGEIKWLSPLFLSAVTYNNSNTKKISIQLSY